MTTAAHWSGLTTDGYQWTFGRRVRSGVIPTEGGRSLVFVSAPVAADGRGRRAFIRCSHGPGWALVGDAGYSKDPLSVHGFTDPLRDAELLAGAVLAAGLHEPAALHDALAQYETMRDQLGIPVFEVVDRIAGHQWDDAELADLLLRLSSAMTDEVEALAGVDVSGR